MSRQLFPNRDRTIAYLSRARVISTSSIFSPSSVPRTHARSASNETPRNEHSAHMAEAATIDNNASNIATPSTSASSSKANTKRVKTPRKGAVKVEKDHGAVPSTDVLVQTQTEEVVDIKAESTVGKKKRDSIIDLGIDVGFFRYILGMMDSETNDSSTSNSQSTAPSHVHQPQSRPTSYFRSRSRTRARQSSHAHAHARRRSGDTNSTTSSKSRKAHASKGQSTHASRGCRCGKDHGEGCESEPLLTDDADTTVSDKGERQTPPGIQRRTPTSSNAISNTSNDAIQSNTVFSKQMSFKDKKLRRRPDSPAPPTHSSSRDHFRTKLDAMSRKDAPPVPPLLNVDSFASLSGSATLASSSTTAVSEAGLSINPLGRSLGHASPSTVSLSKPYIRTKTPEAPPLPTGTPKHTMDAPTSIPAVPPISPIPQETSSPLDSHKLPFNPRAASMRRRRRVITAAAQQIMQYGRSQDRNREKPKSRDKSLPRIPSMSSGLLSRSSSRKSRRKSRPTSMGKESIKERERRQRDSEVPPVPPLKDWPTNWMNLGAGAVNVVRHEEPSKTAVPNASKRKNESNTSQPDNPRAAPTGILKRSQPASASNSSLTTAAVPDFLLQSRENSAPPTPVHSTPSTPTSSSSHFPFFPRKRRTPGETTSTTAGPPSCFSIARLVGLRGRPRRRSSSAGDLSVFIDPKYVQVSGSVAGSSITPASSSGHSSNVSLSSTSPIGLLSTPSPATSVPEEPRPPSRPNLTVPRATTASNALSRKPSQVFFPRLGQSANTSSHAQSASSITLRHQSSSSSIDHSSWMPRRRASSGPVALSHGPPNGGIGGGKTKVVDKADVTSEVLMQLRKLKAH